MSFGPRIETHFQEEEEEEEGSPGNLFICAAEEEMSDIWRRAGGKGRNDVLHPCCWILSWSHFIWPTPERQHGCLATGSWESSEKKRYAHFVPFQMPQDRKHWNELWQPKKDSSRWSRHGRRHPPPLKERGVSSTGGLYTQYYRFCYTCALTPSRRRRKKVNTAV